MTRDQVRDGLQSSQPWTWPMNFANGQTFTLNVSSEDYGAVAVDLIAERSVSVHSIDGLLDLFPTMPEQVEAAMLELAERKKAAAR